VVRVTIDRFGNVEAVDLRQSSGVDSLDEAALQAASKARFKPFQRAGIALRAFADIPFNFVLRK
jgi:protein TonB